MNPDKFSAAIVDEAKPWFSWMREHGRSPKTVSTYAAAILNLARFLPEKGPIRAKDVTQDDLEAWVRSFRDCSLATVDVFVRAVKTWFSWLVSEGALFVNPAADLTAPPLRTKLGGIPSVRDMKTVLTGIKGRGAVVLRDRALLETAYATGARLAELAGMDLADVDQLNGTALLHGKGGRDRVVPLTRMAVAAIKAYLTRGRLRLLDGSTSSALWIGIRGGRRLKMPAIHRIALSRSRKVGLRITIHAIRRATATNLIRNGAHPTHVKLILGHAGYKHLKKYIAAAATELRAMHRKSKLGR